MKVPAHGDARAGGGTGTSIASAKHSALIALLQEGPQVPWQRFIHSYAEWLSGMLANAECIYNENERDIRDLARFVRQGVIRLPNGDGYLASADKALTGDGREYSRIVRWLDRHNTVRNKLDAARKRERELPENQPGAVVDLVRRTQPREQSALEREAERLGLAGT